MLDELINKYELQMRSALSSKEILVAASKKDALQEYQSLLRDSARHDLNTTQFVATRNPDHPTSIKAAKNLVPRRKNQHGQLLMAFRQDDLMGGCGLNADQAGRLSGLKHEDRSNCCYWKRVSELNSDGFLELTGEVRPGEAGDDQNVHRLTEKGRAAADGVLAAAT